MVDDSVGSAAGSRIPLVISGEVADVADVMRTLARLPFFRNLSSIWLK